MSSAKCHCECVEASMSEVPPSCMFCVQCSSHCVLLLQLNANGEHLKDMIMEHNIVQGAVEYIQSHAPQIKTLLS